MGVPGPAIPVRNSYRVHFLGTGDAFYPATEALLKPLKVSVQNFGSEYLPADEFWKTTVAVVSVDDRREISRGDYLLITVASSETSASSAPLTDWIQVPDLWLVETSGSASPMTTAEEWIEKGAGAVVTFDLLGGAAWISRNAAFGQSKGSRDYGSDYGFQHERVTPGSGFFAAGLLQGVVEELLTENEFVKSTFTLDRECLEMLPLHLGVAVETGLAAQKVFSGEPTEALSAVREQLRAWRGPEPVAWGARGR